MAKSELAMIPQQSAAMTPADLVAQALAIGNLDVIPKLLDYKERWESGEARKAFNAAMAAAKAEMPVIIKDQTVDFTSAKGRTNYKYEDMAGLARQVDPILTRHGLSYRYRTVSDKDCMTVICIVAHRDGHSEENSLTAPNDASGNKNPIQAIGSTQTYLQRYTLKAALGLAASKDDDAHSSSNGTISETQVDTLKKLIDEIGGEYGSVTGLYKGFFKKFSIEKLGDLSASEYDNAIDALEMKRKK